jgi:hypothetical protein
MPATGDASAREAGVRDGDDDAAPASDVRLLADTRSSATLAVFAPGAPVSAESAWVTVTDARGIVCFEGPLSADRGATITLDFAGESTTVSVRLETLRSHRQAVVVVAQGSNVYRFT